MRRADVVAQAKTSTFLSLGIAGAAGNCELPPDTRDTYLEKEVPHPAHAAGWRLGRGRGERGRWGGDGADRGEGSDPNVLLL